VTIRQAPVLTNYSVFNPARIVMIGPRRRRQHHGRAAFILIEIAC